jgi:hypothetical protein
LLIHPTLDLLHQLGLNGMAKAFAELEASAEATTLTHPEWLALLLDQEASYRRDRRLAWTRQHLVELGFQHGLQKVANSIPALRRRRRSRHDKPYQDILLAAVGNRERAAIFSTASSTRSKLAFGNRLLDQAGDYAAFIFQPLPLRHLSTDRYEKLKPHIRLIRRS